MSQEKEVDVSDVQNDARLGSVANFKQLLEAFGSQVAENKDGSEETGLTGRQYLKEAIESKTEKVLQQAEKINVLKKYDLVNNIRDTYAVVSSEPVASAKDTKAPAQSNTGASIEEVTALKEEVKSLTEKLNALTENFNAVAGAGGLVEKLQELSMGNMSLISAQADALEKQGGTIKTLQADLEKLKKIRL